MRFRFDPLSRAFSNRCVFDENAPSISVEERLKRIEISQPSKTAVSAAKSEEKRLFSSQAKMYAFKREQSSRAVSFVDAFQPKTRLKCGWSQKLPLSISHPFHVNMD